MWLPSLFQVLSLVWLCSAAWFPLESTQDWDAGTWLFPLLETAGFSATHCLNELHPEHATQLAVKNRKHFGTHFPFVGWERKQTWALANTDTIKMETESCLALGAVWDEPWVTPLGCVPAKTPGLDWRHARNIHVKMHIQVVSRGLRQQRQREVCLPIPTKSGSSCIFSLLVSKEPLN